MPQVSKGLRLGVISPQDAIAAFEARKLLQPSFRWQDVWQAEHQRAFAVAGVSRADVLAVFREQLDAKFAEGTTLAEFRKAIRPALAAKGFWGDVEVTDPANGETRVTRFDDRRLQLIYDVNVRQSYAAGKWDRYQATKKQLPFVLYRTMDDGRVRPEHAAWHNLVLPIDDPWVRSHWCPNGWRCRCVWVQVSQRGVDRLQAAGQKLKFKAPADDFVPYINPWTGEVKSVPRGVDPGFGADPVRNAGRDASLAETVLQKAMRSDAYSGAVVAAQAATDMPALAVRRADQFARWVATAQAAGRPTGAVFTLGTVQPAVVRALAAAGDPLETSVLAVRDLDMWHTLRTSSRDRVPIPTELYMRLPMLLARPAAVLRVTGTDAGLVYVVDVSDAEGKVLKLYVLMSQDVSQVVDGQRARKVMNLVRTASLQMPDALKNAKSFSVVWGAWP
ncbi:MAG: phage minor head protein [Burkholderiaceae bacterium]